MLGNFDAVRAMIEANPGIQRLPGPHGITLLAHAKFGDEGSKSTVTYLESLGDADIGRRGLPVPSDENTAIHGVYAFGNGSDRRLKVVEAIRDGHLNASIADACGNARNHGSRPGEHVQREQCLFARWDMVTRT